MSLSHSLCHGVTYLYLDTVVGKLVSASCCTVLLLLSMSMLLQNDSPSFQNLRGVILELLEKRQIPGTKAGNSKQRRRDRANLNEAKNLSLSYVCMCIAISKSQLISCCCYSNAKSVVVTALVIAANISSSSNSTSIASSNLT